MPPVETLVDEYALEGRDGRVWKEIARHGLDLLPILARRFDGDWPIEALEGFEEIWKLVLQRCLKPPISGETARRIALFQRQVGFLIKKKSYAVKASSPLGYSVFLQNPGEGFSFQQHVENKTEVFHIIEVSPGGFVFLCGHRQWADVYEPDAFSAWLSGRADDRYERYCATPAPGDVVVIDRLRVVHTVLGCVLQEFATASTDMVDRLHDQNLGRRVPEDFKRRKCVGLLKRLTLPAKSQRILEGGGPISSQRIKGGRVRRLASQPVDASIYEIEGHASSRLSRNLNLWASLHVTAGTGAVTLGTSDEVRRISPPNIEVTAGQLLMIPPGFYYQFLNTQPDPLQITEQRVAPDLALRVSSRAASR